MTIIETVVVVAALACAVAGYVAGYRRGLVAGQLRATRNNVVQIDDVLSRWRREQRP